MPVAVIKGDVAASLPLVFFLRGGTTSSVVRSVSLCPSLSFMYSTARSMKLFFLGTSSVYRAVLCLSRYTYPGAVILEVSFDLFSNLSIVPE